MTKVNLVGLHGCRVRTECCTDAERERRSNSCAKVHGRRESSIDRIRPNRRSFLLSINLDAAIGSGKQLRKGRNTTGKATTGLGSAPGRSIAAKNPRSERTFGRRAKIPALLHKLSPRHAKTLDLHQVLHLRSPERADPARRWVHKVRTSSADRGSLGLGGPPPLVGVWALVGSSIRP